MLAFCCWIECWMPRISLCLLIFTSIYVTLRQLRSSLFQVRSGWTRNSLSHSCSSSGFLLKSQTQKKCSHDWQKSHSISSKIRFQTISWRLASVELRPTFYVLGDLSVIGFYGLPHCSINIIAVDWSIKNGWWSWYVRVIFLAA